MNLIRMESKSRYLVIFLYAYATCIKADDIDMTANTGVMLKFLREMGSQTKADTLNLPANASSIRENITDTFSCENRTYGYYADVDNDCQIFHVCLPSEGPTGRNITYKWSFICPSETVFNQEVLVCTYPRDAIDCEDSPLYYDVNLEIGKVQDPGEEKKIETETLKTEVKVKETTTVKNQRRKDHRKQNIIIDNLLKDIVSSELKEKLQEMAFGDMNFEEIVPEAPVPVDVIRNEGNVDGNENGFEDLDAVEGEERIASERSMRNERKMRRGSFRFKADV